MQILKNLEMPAETLEMFKEGGVGGDDEAKFQKWGEGHFVYGLYYPKKGPWDLFYIGVTSHPPRRYKQHLMETICCPWASPKTKKIYSGTLSGYWPKMSILDCFFGERKDAEFMEKYWIKDHLKQGFRLTNIKGV